MVLATRLQSGLRRFESGQHLKSKPPTNREGGTVMSEATQDRCSLPKCTAWFPAAPGKLYCSLTHAKAAARARKRGTMK